MARTSTADGSGAGTRASPAAGTLLAWLSSAAFPADRALLVDAARSHRAPAWLVDRLRRLPAGCVFQNAEQLAHTLRTTPLVRVTSPPNGAGARATRPRSDARPGENGDGHGRAG